MHYGCDVDDYHSMKVLARQTLKLIAMEDHILSDSKKFANKVMVNRIDQEMRKYTEKIVDLTKRTINLVNLSEEEYRK